MSKVAFLRHLLAPLDESDKILVKIRDSLMEHTRIIIDTNIILSNPEILLYHSKNIRLYLLDIIKNELLSYSKNNKNIIEILDILQESIKNGNLHEIKVIKENNDNINISLGSNYRISNVDVELLSFTNYLTKMEKNKKIILATNDKALSSFANNYKIETINSNDLINLFIQEKNIKKEKKSNTLKNKLNKYKHKKIFNFIINLLVSILAGLITNLIASNFNIIINSLKTIFDIIKIWGIIILLPLLGFILFYLRSLNRLLYGLVEFIIGFTTALWVFIPNFTISSIGISEVLRLSAGLYIIVRSLDNISNGLRSSRFQKIWLIWKNIFKLTN